MTAITDSRVRAAILRAELSRRASTERLSIVGLNLEINASADLAELATADVARELDQCHDDRKEIADAPALAQQQFRSVAAVIPVSQSMVQRRNGDWVLAAPSMRDFYDVDVRERFADQPVGAIGAAFLIAPQVLVTAAHVVAGAQTLRRLRFVFGYQMHGTRPVTVFREKDVYEADLLSINQPRDIATLKLDRPVPSDRKPLTRRSSRVADDEPLYVIGFPVGLPAKYADNGIVINNRGRRFFTTDLDVMDGNSGSPIFSAPREDVVGVLSTAPIGFTSIDGRLVSDFCHDPSDVPIGVSRITNLSR